MEGTPMIKYSPVAVFAALLITAGALLLLAAPSSADPRQLPPCATEDSVSCYWDASLVTDNRNGVGQSFYTDADGTPHYLP